jgi:hypothetical protein
VVKLKLPESHPYALGRTCSACNEFKDASNYTLERDSRCVGGIAMRSTCKPCTEFRKYKAFMKKRYGITWEDYQSLLEKQEHKCAICSASDAQSERTSGRLFIDHCHKTGKVRGLLCSKCNHALGQFNDDEELLLNAISYLRSSRD